MSDFNKEFADKTTPPLSVNDAYFKDFMDDAEKFPTLRKALKDGGSPSEALVAAAIYCDVDAVKFLVGAGADISALYNFQGKQRTIHEIAEMNHKTFGGPDYKQIIDFLAEAAQAQKKPAAPAKKPAPKQ